MAEQRAREALERIPELRRYLLAAVRRTGRKLGTGSYGSVDEVVVDGVVCAAKLIHEILLDVTSDPRGIQIATRKYVAECQLMSDLRHPHIVQFLGLCFLEGSSLPALVMEKLVASLDEVLESTPDIPLGLKKSFLTDVIKGLLYLHNHTPTPIIHRDLSARNILLNSAMVAKISDLGNSRMVQFQPGQLARTLSCLPGTQCYMPPEALDETALTRYGPSLDIFSFGHVALFILTQVFPGDLLRPTYPDPDNLRRILARSEVERRQPYLSRLYQQLSREYPLVQLVEHCLDDIPQYRPSTMEVLQQLEAVEIEDPYQDLTKLDMIRLLQQQTDPQRDEQVQRLQTQLQQMQLDVTESRTQRDRAVQEKDDIIRGKDAVIQQLQLDVTESRTQRDRAVQEKDEVIRGKDVEIQRLQVNVNKRDRALQEKDQEKERAVQEKERAIQEKDGVIQEKEQVIRDNEELIQALLEEVRQKDDLLCQRVHTPQEERPPAKPMAPPKVVGQRVPTTQEERPATKPVAPPKVATLHKHTKIRFQQLKQLPTPMSDAQAVMYRGALYVGGGSTPTTDDDYTLCVYNFQPDTWDTIKTPTRLYALAVYQGHIVLAGGVHGTVTSQLWITDQNHTFEKTIPPMSTATRSATAIANETHLIVAGGSNDGYLDTVQVYNGIKWTLLRSLPVPALYMKYVCRNDILYLIGGTNQDKKVFHTSLPSLLQSAHQPKAAQTATTPVWNTFTDAPLKYSSIVVLRSGLVSVGGSYPSYSSSLHLYSQQTHMWDKMDATLPQPLRKTYSIALPTGELMVIGGLGTGGRSPHVYKGTFTE